VDYQQVLDKALAQGETIAPMVADVTGLLHDLRRAGASMLFEGAQGALLDIDHGTYPFVTSSNTTAGGACTGSGMGPRHLDYVLGIVKAYTTRVGAGPFPTELFDTVGDHMGEKGNEFGATTGRKRRCGWLDLVALKRSFDINSITGVCITKLDVLDGLDTVRLCVSYDLDGQTLTAPPVGAEAFARCRPNYIDMPGWTEKTFGLTRHADLPQNARRYLARIEELTGVPIDIVSTGPDRVETMILRDPFAG
jgi:adenylosuccinate synthase